MAYSLTLDYSEESAIQFVGYRYSWSSALCELGYDTAGTHIIPEYHAWKLVDAFEQDTEGRHSPFPMLSPDSSLYHKLETLWQSVV